LAGKLGKFIRDLHEKGIYFRSLHLGNIVLTPENQFGLIDISDMKFYRKPLSKNRRLRNFKHCSRYLEDNEKMSNYINEFIAGYRSRAPLPLCKKSFSHLFSN
tara:strand:- start:58669 stop:58977 length:309 start_codon:yes stop_codon:yes gene_type:complete